MKNNPNYFYNPERIKVENPFIEICIKLTPFKIITNPL